MKKPLAIGAAVAAGAALLAGVGLTGAATSSDNALTTVESCRLFDTRPAFQVGDRDTPLGPGGEITITVGGDTGECTNIPANPTAASLQVTAIGPTEATFFTVYPGDLAQRPNISQLNPTPDVRVTSNSVLVPLTTDGEFTLFNLNGEVDVAIDLLGVHEPVTATPGPQGPQGEKGDQGDPGPATPATYSGPNWGVLPRSVVGSAQAFLRGGPSTANFTELGATPQSPPYGDGSLGLIIGDGSQKIDFGNEVDYADDELLPLLQAGVGFHFFATRESNDLGGTNVPNIKIEIDPNGAGDFDYDEGNPLLDFYSTLVFIPAQEELGWSDYIDATNNAAGTWFLTLNTGDCSISSRCTFDELVTFLGTADVPPTIHSVGVGKGSDSPFVGAIDGFRLGDTIFDFEPLGVIEMPVPAPS